MSLLKSFLNSVRDAPEDDSPGETLPVKMDLEERMAYRREVLFDVIRISLVSHGIPGDSCRLQASRVDKRGHLFVVMIDLPGSFLNDARGSHPVLAGIGKSIGTNARSTGLIDVVGAYWRVIDAPPVEHGSDTSSGAPGSIAQALLAYGHQNISPRTYASDLAPLSAA